MNSTHLENMCRKRKMKLYAGNHGVVVLALMMMIWVANGEKHGTREIAVGVILDMDTLVGKSIRVSILMAIEDIYEDRNNSTTIIIPHFRDSKYDNVDAASAGSHRPSEKYSSHGYSWTPKIVPVRFVLDIAQRSHVPMISPATNPDLSPIRNPYFIRIAQASSTQAQLIAALVKYFGWREVVFVYEDTDFGRGAIPYLSDSMANISTQVKYRTLLSPSSSDDKILQELYKLKTMQTRVFVVHMLPTLASRFFKNADEAGMMAQGYAWIITDVLTGLFHQLDPVAIHSMQGVLGAKPYIPQTNHLTNFERRWRRRFHKEYPDTDRVELDMFGIWSYDFVVGLAVALKRLDQTEFSTTFKRPSKASTDLASIGASEMGSRFLPMIRNLRLNGMSGDFHVVNGQLKTSAYQIVNVISKGEKPIGFWSSRNGILNGVSHNKSSDNTTNKDNLGTIIWPGDTPNFPKGWEIATGGDNILRVGIPAKGGFVEFVHARIDPKTNVVNASGFCIDVFKAVINELPFDVPYKFIPYENPNGEPIGDYNDLVYQIALENFDIVVGDITILSNRTKYVEFTLPYTESGVAMLVLAKVDDSKNIWIFMRPLEMELWITIGAFFIYIGFVVWVLEHRVNKEFRGPPHQQVGMIFWFSFSTLVFAHKEKMISNLSRFVVIVWIFVVLVLTSSYTASLASMLTVQKLRPTLTNMVELKASGDYVGYQDGSFVGGMLAEMGFDGDKLKKYTSIQEYEKALSDGTTKNGVSAIVDEVPYFKMLQAKNCNSKRYVMVGPTHKTSGFGFAFPKGSPLVAEFSRAILKVIEDQMGNISDKWIRDEADCPVKNEDVEPFEKLTLNSFKGLFLVAGLSSTCALVVFLFSFLYENKEILESDGSMQHKLTAIIQNFDKKKDQKPSETESVDHSHMYVEENMTDSPPLSPTISVHNQGEEFFSPMSPIDHRANVSD